MEASKVRDELKAYIRTNLLHDPAYPLADDEPLITAGLMDSFSLAQIAVFIETSFGVNLPDNDLTVPNMDTLELIVARVMAGPSGA